MPSGRRWKTPKFLEPGAPVRRFLVRACLFLAVFLLSVTLLGLVFRFAAVPILLSFNPDLDTPFFDLGVFGIYPEQRFHSFNRTAPIPRTPTWKTPICDIENENGGLVLFDVHGSGVTSKGPMIVDLKGDLIWTDHKYGQHTMNFKLQEWNGSQYLTFWAGERDWGKYYMLDSGYNLAKVVHAVGDNLHGDPHEFKITPEGTAMFVVYDRRRVDLSQTEMAHLEPFIIDAVIQEVDIATNELLFEWRASEHFTDGAYLKYTYDTHRRPLHPGLFASWGAAYDYFHMNSVDKDKDGNFLVSIRYTHQVICISSKTGKILWGFGGKASDFTDLDDGKASEFMWQHDARWIDEDNGILGLFDNSIKLGHRWDASQSQGRLIHLDVHNKTAKLLHSYATEPYPILSVSQGSFQHLPAKTTTTKKDQVFVGWGSSGAWSLHDYETEESLCETHYAPSYWWYFERAKAYRTTRAPKDFNFRPEAWDPNAVVKDKKIYVSWNGGVEVRSWRLYGRVDDGHGGKLEELSTVSRVGFETAFDLPPSNDKYSAYRIAALDSNGKNLRYSNIIDPSLATGSWFSYWPLVLFVAAATVVVTVFLYLYRRRERRLRLPTMFSMPGIRLDGYRKVDGGEGEALMDSEAVDREPE